MVGGDGLDAGGPRVDTGGMDQQAVIARFREIEREYVVGWCGAGALERPGEALRALVEEQRSSEGDAYEGGFTQLDRVGQVVVLALCERYGLRAFRRKGARRSTIDVAGPKTFITKVFYPLVERAMAAMVMGVDHWLHGVVEACIRDDVPADEDYAAALASSETS